MVHIVVRFVFIYLLIDSSWGAVRVGLSNKKISSVHCKKDNLINMELKTCLRASLDDVNIE